MGKREDKTGRSRREPARMAQEVRMLEGGAVSRWFYVELRCQGTPSEKLDAHLDAIMDALVDCGDAVATVRPSELLVNS